MKATDPLLDHIRKVAAEVATWPRWKQLVLGTFPEPPEDYTSWWIDLGGEG